MLKIDQKGGNNMTQMQRTARTPELMFRFQFNSGDYLMYSKSGIVVDRREMLKIKVKSLAEEARIIRKEERRTQGLLREELNSHRRMDVRFAARTSYMAYGMIRGRGIEQTERPGSPRSETYWKAVRTMIQKYGPTEEKAREKLIVCCK